MSGEVDRELCTAVAALETRCRTLFEQVEGSLGTDSPTTMDTLRRLQTVGAALTSLMTDAYRAIRDAEPREAQRDWAAKRGIAVLVANHGIYQVLESLAEYAIDQADDIRYDHGDDSLAEAWDKIAGAVARGAAPAEYLGGVR